MRFLGQTFIVFSKNIVTLRLENQMIEIKQTSFGNAVGWFATSKRGYNKKVI